MRNVAFFRVGVAVLTMAFLDGCSSLRPPVRGWRRPSVVTVRKKGGSWYFFYQGRPFVVRGVCCVLPQDFSAPENDQGYNAISRYKGQYSKWRFDTLCRLRCWGFNTVSAWSHPSLYGRTDFFYTVVIDLQGPDARNRLVDVFSRQYRETVMRIARAKLRRHATNSTLVGYYVNNELPWYGEKAWPTNPKDGLLVRYLQLGPGAPGKRRVVRFLRDFYESFDAFLEDFSTSAENFDELLHVRDAVPRSPDFRDAERAWCGIVADRYYSMCRKAIRKFDPHHLILGSRFARRAPLPVIRACARYCDVVSLNYYDASGQPDPVYLDTLVSQIRRPLIISEFSWRAKENSSGCPNTRGAAVTVPTQQKRAENFEAFVTALMKKPYVVGYEWFQYFDEPPAGRSFDGENSNYGLVDIFDRPYVKLLRTISRVNREADRIHARAVRPGRAHPAVLDDFPTACVPPEPPAGFRAVEFSNPAAWRVFTWGDTTDADTYLDARAEDGILVLQGNSGGGWGCGVSIIPEQSPQETAAGKLAGAQRVIIDLEASRSVELRFFVNETGHGPPDADSYAGVKGADGEAYISFPVTVPPGRHSYVFRLCELEKNTAYGNQRGNGILDTQGIAEVGLVFTPGQVISLKVSRICFRGS
ncbi:MAG: hypothetical protein DRP22_04265 [Verrucomicrobia bacterium]|nr:MAG: hypothetical protein DRP22_04265 [Verrucomicrobiota bacterium]